MVGLFFYCAGTTDLPQAWLYFGLYLVSLIANMIIFMKYNPNVVQARGELLKGKMQWWDKVYALLSIIFMFAIPIISGLDVKSRAAPLGIEYYIIGVIMFIVGWTFTSWALVVNKFFEGSVRIQKERGHKVVTTGPYTIVRHPGYAGMILFYLSMPLGLGSLYGLIPAFLLAGDFVFRTHFEDEFLRKELKGYKKYTKRVRYRLVPGIW